MAIRINYPTPKSPVKHSPKQIFVLTDEIAAALKAHCDSTGVSKSETVRRALLFYFKEAK